MCLILFPGSIMRSGLHSSLFFTVSRMWFLLLRLACMVILNGLWHRLSKSSMGLSQYFPLRGVVKPGHGLGFISQCKRDLCQGLVVLAKRPHLESGNEAHPKGKKSASGYVSTSSANTRRKEDCGGQCFWCVSPQSPHHLHLQFFRLVCFSNF